MERRGSRDTHVGKGEGRVVVEREMKAKRGNLVGSSEKGFSQVARAESLRVLRPSHLSPPYFSPTSLNHSIDSPCR